MDAIDRSEVLGLWWGVKVEAIFGDKINWLSRTLLINAENVRTVGSLMLTICINLQCSVSKGIARPSGIVM